MNPKNFLIILALSILIPALFLTYTDPLFAIRTTISIILFVVAMLGVIALVIALLVVFILIMIARDKITGKTPTYYDQTFNS